MDDLTRERFWPKPKAIPLDDETANLVAERRRVLLDALDYEIDRAGNLRARARAMKRDRRLVRAIRGLQ